MYLNEFDPFCCRVLRKNFPEAHVDERDIRLVEPADLVGFAECHFFAGIGGFPLGLRWAGWSGPVWTGGFPCQDISTAGKGAGLAGERSGLWWTWFALIRACRPVWLLIENVPALRTRGADDVLAALEAEGYACWPLVVGAEAVGAPHRRERVWIVAHAKGDLRSPLAGGTDEGEAAGTQQARRGRVRQRLRRADDGGLANAGDGQLDDAPVGRLEGRRLHVRRGRHDEAQSDTDRAGEVADAPEQRLEVDGSSEHAGERTAAAGSRWPSRPGEPQHDCCLLYTSPSPRDS